MISALDLFCGGGGSSKGLELAGFDNIVGVDHKPQRDYPYEFIEKDVFTLDVEWCRGFDFIWASPPCQAYSVGTAGVRNRGKSYPDLIGSTRLLLNRIGKSWVIENVIGAPIRRDLMLCGEMFGLHVIRHRIFEMEGFYCPQPPHQKHKNRLWDGSAIPVYMRGISLTHSWEYAPERRKYYATVAGHGGDGGRGNHSLESWQEAMEIDWVTDKKTLAQCVPPKYAEYIAKQFLNPKQRQLTEFI